MSDNEQTLSSISSEGNDTDSEKERLRWMRHIIVEQQQHLLSQYNRSMTSSGKNSKWSAIPPRPIMYYVVPVYVGRS